jgi:uncharacterized protein
MPTYTVPGVFLEEIPSGARPIDAVGTSTAAFVGYATKGPIGEAVRITGLEDYDRHFDGLRPGTDHLGQAVAAYFRNGGSTAYVVRLARGATAAVAHLLDPGVDAATAGAGDRLLTFAATSQGTWAHRYRVRVATRSSGSYDVEIQELQRRGTTERAVTVETHSPVSLDPDDPTYLGVKLADASEFARLETSNVVDHMVASSRSGSLDDWDPTALNGAAMTLRIQGASGPAIDRAVQFAEDAFSDDDELAVVASQIQQQVRGTSTLAAVAQFAAEAGEDPPHLLLTAGEPGPGTAVLARPPTGPDDPDDDTGGVTVDDAAAVLRLGAANGGVERTGRQALHDLLTGAGAEAGGLVTRFAGGGDGSGPAAADYDPVFAAFRRIRDINTICLPGQTWGAGGNPVIDAAITHAEDLMSRMVLLDPPEGTTFTDEAGVLALDMPTSSYAVMYYPWLDITNPFYDAEQAPDQARTVSVAPSGFAAGVWARIDGRRGVWKAPAGTETALRGVARLRVEVDATEQSFLNPLGVNCIRRIPGYGHVVWGARTRATQADPEWRYVPVRRTAIFIERSIYDGIQWAVFEPNDHPLWSALRANIGAFLDGLHRGGAFQGEKASDAYFVRCGLGDTMTQADIDRGQVIAIVGFAPLKPAEFVIIRIQQIVGQL